MKQAIGSTQLDTVEQTESATISHSETDRRVERLSSILRGIGALVLISSAAVFMAQHWYNTSDLYKYWMLMAQTLVVVATGFFCGLGVKESKGARTFLGIALASFPAHFAVISGFINSTMRWAPGDTIHHSVSWLAPSSTAAWMSALGAFALLIPVGYLCAMTLARPVAKEWIATYIVANTALLIPTRNADLVGLIFAATLVGLGLLETRKWSRSSALATWEGALMRLALFVPALVMVGRQGYIYGMTELTGAAVFGAIAYLTFWVFPRHIENKNARRLLQNVSLIPTALSWVLAHQWLMGTLDIHRSWELITIGMPFSLILGAMSLGAENGGVSMRRWAATIGISSAALQLFLYPGAVSSVFCLGLSIAVLAYGISVEQKVFFYGGIAGTGYALLVTIVQAVRHVEVGQWAGLAILGTTVILTGSFIEKNHRNILLKLNGYRVRLRSWSL
jgi:hypothetical protein